MNKKHLGIIIGVIVGVVGTSVVIMAATTTYDGGAERVDSGNRQQHMGYGLGYQGGGKGMRTEVGKHNCLGDECLAIDDLEYPVGTLSKAAEDALYEAIVDEYYARSLYAATLDTFGMVRPFSMIMRAEEMHINALKSLYDRYSIAVPSEPDHTIEIADSVALMCAIGVEAEIANAALYREKLLPAVEGYEDIEFVFTNLMNASQNNHLRAFTRCAP